MAADPGRERVERPEVVRFFTADSTSHLVMVLRLLYRDSLAASDAMDIIRSDSLDRQTPCTWGPCKEQKQISTGLPRASSRSPALHI